MKIFNGVNRKLFISLLAIILIALGIIAWVYYTKPEEEGLIVEEPAVEEYLIERKLSCFDSTQDPIPICNCDDLQKIAENLTANYKLENDIDCSDTKDWNQGKGFEPIGKEKEPFLGSFNGQNHIIVNLYINRIDEDYVGLFGYLECVSGPELSFPCLSRGKVTSIGLKNIDIKGHNSTGGLAGNNRNGFITNSYANGLLIGNDDIGGLVGKNMENGVITASSAEVNVFNGNKDVGGLVGENEGTVIGSYALGFVSGIKGVGGLVGENEGIITHSYATGNVTGDENVGGLIGDLDPGTVTSSYATGFISGNKDVGGFIGDNHAGLAKNNFSTGEVKGFDRMGGFNGVNHGGRISNSYWNKKGETSLSCIGENKEGGFVKCYTIEGNESYFYDLNNKPMSQWKFPPWSKENNGKDFPVLKPEQYIYIEEINLTDLIEELIGEEEEEEEEKSSYVPLDSGATEGKEEEPSYVPLDSGATEGKEEISCFDFSKDPVSVCNCQNLQRMKEDLSANYQLENDIDCSNTKEWNGGKGFEPIGVDTNSRISGFQGTRFSGTFNGQNHIITGLFIKRPNKDYLGLFGYSKGKVKNVGLKNVNITGNEEIGGLVGENHGTITNSYTTGTVSGYEDVGGLAGENEPGGIITDCYSSATSNGTEDIGGLVGENEATITNCYATGKVAGADNVGGFVGDNEGIITNSYSTGGLSTGKDIGGFVGVNQGSINNSYWNKEKGSSLDCVGKIKSGSVDCHIVQDNKSYFYALDNEPMSQWKFPPWSRKNDGKDYPVLVP